ncbi:MULTISPECIES: WYL domain-containing protein [Haemophilus]|uniref:WYL domain-containing protein n=1 Tax=Haemophilus TaxID=724 RepID=UPI000803473B|nr:MULTISPECIES: WYL domain-containing protein [Haemophilus]OBX88735.1 hypothetical protein A9499_02555 [Haemophilus haemolyticus]
MSKYRFLNATATTFTFERSKFNLKHYLAEQHFGFGNGKKIRLTFRIGKPYGFHLTETPLSTDQEITDEGETYLVRATVVESEMLNWWMRSLERRLRRLGENI